MARGVETKPTRIVEGILRTRGVWPPPAPCVESRRPVLTLSRLPLGKAGVERHAPGELRHVLVITGKGSSMGSDGVLRQAVPHWFATPSFRILVNGYEDAARNHGGTGAMYVRMRRQLESP